MKVSTLRKYLLSDIELFSLLDNKESIWLVEKPEDNKTDNIIIDNYIVMFYKPLCGGYIKDYQLEFRIIGKDLNKLINIQDRLIELLDDPRGEKIIKDENFTFRHIELLNGGGQVKNPETGNFEIVVFFLCKI